MERNDLIERLHTAAKWAFEVKSDCEVSAVGARGHGSKFYAFSEECEETAKSAHRAFCVIEDAVDVLGAHEATIATLSEALAEAEKKGAAETERESAYYGALVLCLDRYEEMASKANLDRLVEFITEFQEAISDRAPLCKLNRWLGYIQGTLIGEEVTTVEAERNWTRRLFRPLDFPAPPRDLSQGGQHG